ncbi:hypothetical protein [Streptomyces eurythermus]|uniref:hypothetical protein n=1 Tax=Streptomyces eurythermus TaxID=42237 RepID=UPI003407FA4F
MEQKDQQFVSREWRGRRRREREKHMSSKEKGPPASERVRDTSFQTPPAENQRSPSLAGVEQPGDEGLRFALPR